MWHDSQVLGGMQNTVFCCTHSATNCSWEMLEQSDEIKLAHTQTGNARHLVGSDIFHAFFS